MFSFFKKKSPSSASVDEVPAPAAAPDASSRHSWIAKLKNGLGKTAASISHVFGGSRIDEALFEDLESALLMADAGVAATDFLIQALRR